MREREKEGRNQRTRACSQRKEKKKSKNLRTDIGRQRLEELFFYCPDGGTLVIGGSLRERTTCYMIATINLRRIDQTTILLVSNGFVPAKIYLKVDSAKAGASADVSIEENRGLLRIGVDDPT